VTDDLTTWLRARFDDDERVARAVRDQRWVYRRSHDSAAEQTDHVLLIGDQVVGADNGDDPLTPSEAEHIARHDPKRVLAEVDAKRRILAEYANALNRRKQHPDMASAGALLTMVRVVKLLAVPYANRDGYREEWRP